MALEDVVQGVQVKVSTDGVDDAKSKIGQLDKAIGDLSKTAETASGARGSGRDGIGGLTKAFADLSATGAQAFANIARSAASGDITGLATLIGGRFSGSVAEAGKALGNFILQQDSAAMSNAAMAKEFGTTPEIMQGIKESFAGAGISAGGFERLVNRMSRQVVNDYSGMMANLRTDNDTQEKATLRLQTAQENYQKSLGVPPETFAAMDKLREQKMAHMAVDDAVEAQRQAALKSIPHVTELLRESAHTHRENTDLMEVNVQTLRKSIEYMAGSAPGHIAKGIDVLKTEFDLIKSGAIDADKAYELLSSQMGARMSAGLSGMDTAQTLQYARAHGSEGITAAQAGKSEIEKMGLGQTTGDTEKATTAISAWSTFTSLLGALTQKIGTTISPAATTIFTGFTKALEALINSYPRDIAPKVSTAESAFSKIGEWVGHVSDYLKDFDQKSGEWERQQLSKVPLIGKYISPWTPPPEQGPDKPPETTRPLPGKPIPGGVTSKSIGSGPGKIYHLPPNYGEPAPEPTLPAPTPTQATYPTVPNAPEYQHMSVLDDANAPWRSLRSGGESAPIPDVGPKIAAAGNEIVSALESVKAAITGFTLGSSGPSAVATIPKWQGGAINSFGYSGGGRISINGMIPGFAEGGSTNDIAPMMKIDALRKTIQNADADTLISISRWQREAVERILTKRPYAEGGLAEGIPGFATGSIRGPGTGTSDSILARLSNGEFVMKDAAVRTYGEGFMHAINNMQIPPPRYDQGGMVPASSLPHFASGGGMEPAGSILHLHVGGQVFSGLRAPAAVADQLRKFAVGQQTSQTGKKPSWAGG